MALMKGKIIYIVRDKYGKILKKGKQPMHSFTQNFAQMLWGAFFSHFENNVTYSIPPITLTDINGTQQLIAMSLMNRDPQQSQDWLIPLSVNANDSDDSYGLVIGQSSQYQTPNDTALLQKYSEADFHHGAVGYDPLSTTPTSTTFTVKRDFTNIGGGPLTIGECGLYARHDENGNAFNVSQSGKTIFCILRDTFATPIQVPVNTVITIIYTFTFNV